MAIRICWIISFFICFTPQLKALEIDLQTFSYWNQKTYLEMCFRVGGSSVTYRDTGNVLQAGVSFTFYLRKGAEIVHAEKFLLQSPKLEGSRDFLTMRRFYASPGEYLLEVEAHDIYQVENKIQLQRTVIVMPDAAGKNAMSDIVLLPEIKKSETENHPLVKNGIFMEPLAYKFAGSDINTAYAMTEIYLADTAETYFLAFHTTPLSVKSDTETKPLFRYKKLDRKPVQVVIIPVTLNEYVSGEYQISWRLQKSDKTVADSRQSIILKSNPAADLAMMHTVPLPENNFTADITPATMDYILKAHIPVTDNIQVPMLHELIKSGDYTKGQHFIFNFWNKRHKENAGSEFKKYMEVAKAVDNNYYSTVGYGFQTHRGYIFLKYGRPDNVLSIDNEPDAPPYEIWYYNKIAQTNQTNVRFLFYNASLAHNDFWLLHSTCYGERNNPSWETELYKSVPKEKIGNTIDATEVQPNWNRNARRYFREF
jgi:GWxTD domain-containing protein